MSFSVIGADNITSLDEEFEDGAEQVLEPVSTTPTLNLTCHWKTIPLMDHTSSLVEVKKREKVRVSVARPDLVQKICAIS